MSLTGRAFISAGEVLFRLTPLRDVRLVAVQPFMRELAACPHLANLRRLDLTGNRIGPVGARELAASPHLNGLRELGLDGNALGTDGVAALAAAPWLAGLTRLELADNGLAPADVARVLARAVQLTGLDVSGSSLGRDAPSIVRPGLHSLAAARCELGPDGISGLVTGFGGNDLESLDLRHNRLGPAGIAALARRGPFPALGRLDLGFNDGDDAGFAGLATGAFPTVRVLGLRANRLNAVPAGPSPSTAVEDLDLSVNPLGDDGAAAVARGFPNLTRLDFGNTALTDDGLRRLLPALPSGLRVFSLAWNPLGDAAAFALAGWPGLARLESLDLTGTRVGPRGAKALVESAHRRGAVALGDRFGTIPA
jgi:hypothetical protein